MNYQTHRLFQIFKYAVYALLTVNVYLFFREEWAASSHRFTGEIELGDLVEAFAATIDTASWIVLLLMFELETSVLADHHFTRRVSLSLHALRAICYGIIVYAFLGYLSKLGFLLGITPVPEITDLCQLAADQWAYAIDLDEYQIITAENCASFSSANVFFQLPGIDVVVDKIGKVDIQRLAWVDVINAAVWLLIVLILEIDVRLQDRDLMKGTALAISNFSKYILYSLLVLALIYWGVKGDVVDAWDSFLWLVAFAFIETNVHEWRQESNQESNQKSTEASA